MWKIINRLKKNSVYWVAVFVSLFFVFFFVYFETAHNNLLNTVKSRLDFFIYDLRLNSFINETKKLEPTVVFVDIDKKSLEKYGRWPWSRDKLISLVQNLQNKGVVVIAFDVIFSEPEENIFDAVFKDIPSYFKQLKPSELENLQQQFNIDYKFSQTLKNGEFILPVIFEFQKQSNIGKLPQPYLNPSSDILKYLQIPEAQNFTANIDILQKNVPSIGFISVIPDSDGLIRRVPLLISYDNKIYASLALQAVTNYLLVNNPELIIKKAGAKSFLEGINLAGTIIPVDNQARMFIPFQGPPRTIQTFSAADILDNLIGKDQLENTLVFIGTSALGVGDLKATPLSGVFPGTEIQATVANAILSKQFITAPDWISGLYISLLFLLGILLSFILPAISTTKNIVICFFLIILMTGTNLLLWRFYLIALPLVSLIFMVFFISICNAIVSYFSERKNKLQITSMFGQYVPPEHIQNLIKQADTLNLGGEVRNMTVLFSDVVSFTTLSEKLSPSTLTSMLNFYLSNMSEVLFQNNGTIDKYVGDMIMAFWNAPLKDDLHAKHAMQAAIGMQQRLLALKESFEKQNFPHFKIGIGIHTGEMLVGDMGSTYRRNYTVLGDAVNLASRLESLTRFYGVDIIVSEACVQATTDLYFCKLDMIKVKGKTRPVVIYELIIPPAEGSDLEPLKHEIKLCEKMLDYYYAQNWPEMGNFLDELKKLNPQKRLYQIYTERLLTLKNKPIDSTWNGIFEFTSKH